MAWGRTLPSSIKTGASATGVSALHTSTVASSSRPARHAPPPKSGPRSASPPSSQGKSKSNGSSDVKGENGAAIEQDNAPLIISLILDEASQKHLTSLRSKYFPKKRNFLAGHVTFFHALPASHLPQIVESLSSYCSASTPFQVRLQAPTLRGSEYNKAVFIPLSSKKLYDIRATLQETFRETHHMPMTEQDQREKFWPHVTVVNKVEPEEAEAVFEQMQETQEGEKLRTGRAVGLDLWRYRGGPWSHEQSFMFGQ